VKPSLAIVPAKPESAAERFAELKAQAAREADDAIATLLEGATRALEVTDPVTSPLLAVGVCDRLRRLGEHVQAELKAISAVRARQ
jgi:hypothetical protein